MEQINFSSINLLNAVKRQILPFSVVLIRAIYKFGTNTYFQNLIMKSGNWYFKSLLNSLLPVKIVVLQSPSKNASKVSLTVNRTKKRKVIFFFFYIFNMAVLDWPNKVEVELQSWQFSPGNQYWTPYWRLLMHGQKTKGSSFPTERCLLLYPKLYIPSTLNIDLIFWHPQWASASVKC